MSKFEGGSHSRGTRVFGPHRFILQIVICVKMCSQCFSGILERMRLTNHLPSLLLGMRCHQSPKTQQRILMYIQVYDSFSYHSDYYYHYSHPISFSPWGNVTFQCYGKSMRQKLLMVPQIISVDWSTKTKYHIHNIDKEIKMQHRHTIHYWESFKCFSKVVFSARKKRFLYWMTITWTETCFQHN